MSELIDDELIDKVLDVIRDKFPKAFDNPKNYPEDINNAKVEIRKLLQSQQLKKPRITWEEIAHIADSIAFPNDDGKAFSYLVSIFKSKGFDVVENE